MTHAAGTRLGVYEVRSAVGAGGMGEVYRARDLTLGRDVALKVLPDEFAADPERLERFTREAKALAALNHPNIAQIYGFEETTIGLHPARMLVMEFVDGEDLWARINRGPIPIAEALPIARQIAEALEAAHEQGIVHRDLKPANVKVTDNGIVKVLDFGLAKALDAPGAPAADVTNSPTLTGRATQLGVILGTAAYMAPEQAKGRPVDKRADYWAFGVVLYEMLTGRRAFEGGDVTEVLASVIKDAPSLDALPPGTPASVRRLLRRCLAKDRRERIADASTIRLEIDEALAGESVAPIASSATARRRIGLAMVAITIGLAALVGIAAWTLKPAPPVVVPAVTKFTVALPGSIPWSRTPRHIVAITPDGSRVGYVANQQLFTRSLDELEGTAVANVRDAHEVFFSPDGKWVGAYFGGRIQKIALSGGAPVPLCAAAAPYGVNWGPDGVVFAQDDGILRVSENGGTPELIVRRIGTERLSNPRMLPGGRLVLMTRGNSTNATWDDAEIIVEELDTHERTVVIRGGSDAHYVSTGHLVYARAGDLLAVPFALDTRKVGGTPVPLLSGVAMATGSVTGGVQAAISNTGTLVYVSGTLTVDQQLAWVDRQGREEVMAIESAVNYPRISPDGTRIAFNAAVGGNMDIFVRERTRDARTRLTFDARSDVAPVWTPDGRRIVFGSSRDGVQNLYWQPADGTGTAERLTTSANPQYPYAFTPDGQTLLFIENDPKTLYDIYALSLTGDRKPRPVLVTPADERRPALSPDGRWMAYQSDESTGTFEVFVRPFPNVDGGRWQVSTGGGSSPLWGDGGHEVLYRQDEVIRRVPVTTAPTFAPGTPAVLLQVPSLLGDDQGVNFTYWPSGQRFLIRKPAPGANGVSEYRVVLNWFEELKALAH